MDLEELAETVSQTLWNLQLDQLKGVCAEAKIPSGNVTTRRALIKLITESMDKVINDEEQDVALYYLKKMLESVDPSIGSTRNTESGGNTTSSPQGTQETREKVDLAERYAQLQRNKEALQKEIRRLSERVEMTPPSQPTTPQNVFSCRSQPPFGSDDKEGIQDLWSNWGEGPKGQTLIHQPDASD